jgi:PST family polysaccharide transporter
MTPEAVTTIEADRLTVAADRMLMKRRSVQGAWVTLSAQGVRLVLQFSSQVALTHWLAPAAFGLVAMVAPVMSLVQIFNDLGLAQATVQRADISPGELSALFWLNFGISLGLAGILALAAPFVAWFYHEPSLTPIVIACSSLLVLSGASAQQIALMNRRMQFVALAGIDIACIAVAVVVGLAAAIAGFGVWSLVLMQAANSLTILLLAWSMSGWVPGWQLRGQDVASLLRFGGHLTGFNLLAYAENSLGPVLIGRLQGAAALGLYDRAFKLVIVPWCQVSLPVARVAVSLLSRLRHAERDYAAAWRRMLQGLMLATGPGLIWASLTANTLAPTLLGHGWGAAAPILADLSLATLFVPFGASAYWLFVSQGRVRAQLRYGVVTGSALVLSAIIGVHWGALGVARCYALFAPFVQGLQLFGALRCGPVGGPAAWHASWPIIVAQAAASCCVALAMPGLDGMPGPAVVRLAVLLGVAYGACGGTLLCFAAGRRILFDVWELRRMM